MYGVCGNQAKASAVADADAAWRKAYAQLASSKQACYESLDYRYDISLSESENDVQAIKQFSAKPAGKPIALDNVVFDFSHEVGWVMIPSNITLNDCSLTGGQAAFASGSLRLVAENTKALAVGEGAIATAEVRYAYAFAANKGRAIGGHSSANVCALAGGVAEAKQYVTFHAMGEGACCMLDRSYIGCRLYVYDMLPKIGFDGPELSTIENLKHCNDIHRYISNKLYCTYDVADRLKQKELTSSDPCNFSYDPQNIAFPYFEDIKQLLENYKDPSVNVVADTKGGSSFWGRLVKFFA